MLHVTIATTSEGVYTSSKLSCDLFIGSSSSNDQNHMKPSETQNRNKEQSSYTHHYHSDGGVQGGQAILVVQDVQQAEGEDDDDVCTQRDEEEEEETVIPASNTVINPRTVMIKVLYTVVTHTAVGAAGGSVEMTAGAPFHSDLNPLHLHILIARSTDIFLLTRLRKDSSIHEGRHGEVRHHEEEEQRIAQRKHSTEGATEPRTRKDVEQCAGSQ